MPGRVFLANQYPTRYTFAMLLLSLLLAVPCCAQQGGRLADLKNLLQSDATKGFERATELFEVAHQAGDLPGMMTIIQATEIPAKECTYAASLENMIDAALTVATERGAWRTVGDLYVVRTHLALWNNQEGLTMAQHYRFLHFSDAAAAAYARAGRKPEGHPGLAEGIYEGVERWCASMKRDNEALRRQLYPMAPRTLQLMESIEEAVIQGRDSEAIPLLRQLLDPLRDEQFDHGARVLAAFVSDFLWLRGTEVLMPDLKALALADEQPPVGWAQDLTYKLLYGCTQAWTGRSDAFHEMLVWCWDQTSRRETGDYDAHSKLLCKMRRMGQGAEADRWTQGLLDRTLPLFGWRGGSMLLNATTSQTDPGIREAILQKLLNHCLEELPFNATNPELATFFWARIQQADPPKGTQWWGTWMADRMLEVAAQVPKVAATMHFTAQGGTLYELAGQHELAVAANEHAKQLAASTPGALVRLALAQAQWLAYAGKWDEVAKRLEEGVKGAPEGAELFNTLMLLGEAQQRLGQGQAAQASVGRAAQMLPRLTFSPGEKASAYMSVAAFTTNSALRLSCLQAGQAAAEASRLPLLIDKFNGQLATLTLVSGDLAAAQTALLQQINRLEQRREQLAFDPLLRQQWFTDNLGPYRRLLEVAAARGNAPLALWVGEKMRARALSDQMAWQKVDMGVSLTADERRNLESLREARSSTYARLQQLTGNGGVAGNDMRGPYLPVRESLGNAKAVSEVEITQLRQQIDDLAQKEAAAASAVRESVPAYAAATNPSVLTGQRLLEEVGKQPGLAVLQYTITSEGLVVVAQGPNRKPQVAQIPVGRERLWSEIGKFRESIWERKPEAAEQAAKLYDLLIRPVEDSLAEARRLWVVADGALHLLPFSALAGPGNVYLGQRVAVAMTPSLNLTVSPGSQRPRGAGTVVLAAPDTGAPPSPGGTGVDSYSPVRSMYQPLRGSYLPSVQGGVSSVLTAMASVPLPGAKAEGEALVAKLSGATLLTGREANRSRLLDAGGTCDILHIATHGYADPDEPEFSGLLLSGRGERSYDVLTAQDVYTWRLKARLVTLSACQTALGETVEGEGLLGLTRAFIYAGAQDVLCTLWPVMDDTTKTLMLAFYDNLQEGVPVETALQQAQLSLLKQDMTKAPFYWAGFVAIRGPQ